MTAPVTAIYPPPADPNGNRLEFGSPLTIAQFRDVCKVAQDDLGMKELLDKLAVYYFLKSADGTRGSKDQGLFYAPYIPLTLEGI